MFTFCASKMFCCCYCFVGRGWDIIPALFSWWNLLSGCWICPIYVNVPHSVAAITIYRMFLVQTQQLFTSWSEKTPLPEWLVGATLNLSHLEIILCTFPINLSTCYLAWKYLCLLYVFCFFFLNLVLRGGKISNPEQINIFILLTDMFTSALLHLVHVYIIHNRIPIMKWMNVTVHSEQMRLKWQLLNHCRLYVKQVSTKLAVSSHS